MVIDWPKSWAPPLLAFKLPTRPRRLVGGALVLEKTEPRPPAAGARF